ncbi:MAG: glycosyltransferase [Planctomycetota bacterium]
MVSCVTPTYGRPAYVHEVVRMFLEQDYPNKELVILNDCPGQVFTCQLPGNAGIRIFNMTERYKTLGEKRNACIEHARGELIAVWDDDDAYLPWYLSYSVDQIQANQCEIFRGLDFWAYWGSGNLHHNQCVPGWAGHPNMLFSKDLWRSIGGYRPVDIGEDSKFFEQIEKEIGQASAPQPVPADDRYFIMRGKSQYPHMSIGGGDGNLDTRSQQVEVMPRPIADPVLRAHYQRLVKSRFSTESAAHQHKDVSTEPDLSVCVSLRNRSAVAYEGAYLPLFPNSVEALARAARSGGYRVELVVADFDSDDASPRDWINDLADGLQVQLLQVDGGFSRGKGLNQAAELARSKRLLLSDADVLIDRDALDRAIEVINEGKAWFPVFHCYNERGEAEFWLDDGYGIVGLHRDLYNQSNGVPEFESWGGEDDLFFDRVHRLGGTIRERWAGLRHQWHPDVCRHEHYAKPPRSDYRVHLSSNMCHVSSASICKIPEVQPEETEKRRVRCASCSQFTDLLGDDVRCRAVPSGRVSLRSGRCRLRKWPALDPESQQNALQYQPINNDNAHFIWLGNDLPAEHAAELARFMVLNPNLRVRLWSKPPENMPADLRDVFDNAAPLVCQQSDIIRVWVLLQYGGMYFDTDIAWLGSVEHLRRKTSLWACGTHMDVSGFAMGASPASPLLAAYRQLIVEKAKHGAYRERQCYGPDCLAELADQGMEVLPRSYFDAVSSHERRLAVWCAQPSERRGMIDRWKDCSEGPEILGLHAGLDSRRQSDEPVASH